jgi:hypothetical protein
LPKTGDKKIERTLINWGYQARPAVLLFKAMDDRLMNATYTVFIVTGDLP